MTPRTGDIVEITSRGDNARWVYSTESGSPLGTPSYVRLLRHGDDGYWTSFTTYTTCVRTVERPAFEVGERVFVGTRPAKVVEVKAGGDVRVEYEPRSVPLGRTGLTRRDEGGQSDVPLWRLTLDNKLPRGALA